MRIAFLLAFFFSIAGVSAGGTGITYIGHASFVITSPAGVRIVVDPFNSNRWLGYHYPEDVEADAVLITHPHYDHDASYYWGDSVPVYREPGHYRFGDVALVGVKGKHADPYGKDFEQKNTIWLVEAGGVRIAHLGDNGPLTDANVRALGRVDVLMVPADGDDHILKGNEIRAIRESLDDPLVIPMHYRLDGFLGLPKSLGPLKPWLDKQSGVETLSSNVTELTPDNLSGRKVLVFQPSPKLRSWSKGLQQGWDYLSQARSILSNHPNQLSEAVALVEKAHASADCIVFSYQWGRALAEAGRHEEAVATLESALARAGRGDWENRMRARTLLGQLYDRAGRANEAHEQYRIVLQHSYRTELLEIAREGLDGP